MRRLSGVLDDVPRLIGQLKNKGFCLGIVSTKFRYRIETILGRAGLLEPFGVIVGGENVSRHKPDPEGLLMATERLGSLGPILYVGESLSDMEAAKRAGLPFVAILSGVPPREASEGYPIHRVLNKLSELIDLL